MSTSQTSIDGVQTDDGGVIARLEARPYAGVLARYWRAAAYDHHAERTTSEWLRLVAIALGVAIAMTVPVIVATVVVATNPSLVPAESTTAYAIAEVVADVYRGLVNVPMAATLVYLIKYAAVEADAELAEVSADD